MRDHLQTQHGQDLEGEWMHAPDAWRRQRMSLLALKERHDGLHEDDAWNEASEPHNHRHPSMVKRVARDEFGNLDTHLGMAGR